MDSVDWGQPQLGNLNFMEFSQMGESEITHEDFNIINTIRPGVHGENDRGKITISGFRVAYFFDDIRRKWGTSRIANHIFTNSGWRFCRFYEFFALEIIYICDELIKDRGRNSKLSRNVLQSIKDAVYENSFLVNRELNTTLGFDFSKLNRFNIRLDEKQLGFLETFNSRVPELGLKGLLLHGDPGVGKTITGLAFHAVSKCDVTVFLVMNASLDNIWKREIDTESRFKEVPKYFISNAPTKLEDDTEIIICHYEYFDKLCEDSFFKKKKVNLWLDESQHFNRMEAGRTELLVDFCRQKFVKHVVFASGTPFKAMGTEVIPMLYCLDPYFNKYIQQAFTKIYGARGQNANDIIAHRIGGFKYRIEKQNLQLDHPIEYDFEVTFKGDEQYTLEAISAEMRAAAETMIEELNKEMPAAITDFNLILDDLEKGFEGDKAALLQFKDYRFKVDEMHRGFDPFKHREIMPICTEYEKKVILPLLDPKERKHFRYIKGIYKYPTLVIRGRLLGRVLVRRRIDCFSDIALHADYPRWINDAEKKVVMFSNYVDVVKTAAERLADEGFEPVIAIGEEGPTGPILQRFNTEPNLNPMIATYATLSTAVEIQVANMVIVIDPPVRSYIMEQAVARVWRRGQDTQVHVINTRLNTGNKPNLSTRGIDIMKWSQEMVDTLLPENARIESPETEEMLKAVAEDSWTTKAASILTNFFK